MKPYNFIILIIVVSIICSFPIYFTLAYATYGFFPIIITGQMLKIFTLLFLVKIVDSQKVKAFKFLLLWFFVSSGSLCVILLSLILTAQAFGIVGVLIAGCLVVYSEAKFLHWLLKQTLVVYEEKEMSFYKSLSFSFVMNSISIATVFLLIWCLYEYKL